MKYKHKRSGILVKWSECEGQYTNLTTSAENSVWLNKEMVEDSVEWTRVYMQTEEIKQLQNIPCLSINDVAKVYVTANRFNDYKEECLEKQGRELIEIVKKKLESSTVYIKF